MTESTNILNIVNGLASESNKLDDEELACLFKYLTKETTNLANVEKFLVACHNNNTKLLYLRELSKKSSSEHSVTNSLKIFDNKLDQLTTSFDNKLDQLTTSFDNKLNQLRTVIGDVYELSARSEVSKVQGPHYTSKFEIYDLNGLIRIALPRRLLPSENPIHKSQIFVSNYRANKISNYIYTNNIREKLKSSISFIRTLPIDASDYNKNLHDLANKADDALKKWSSYEKSGSGSSSNNRVYLINTPSLGIMLMTSHVLDAKMAIENDQAPFNAVLDIDFRGRTFGSDITNITIELGEIKLSGGSKAIKKAYRQLLLRLAVLGFVIEAMNAKNETFKCNLIGKIFVPKTSEVKIQSNWNDGITFPNSAKYYVDIVAIGEKM